MLPESMEEAGGAIGAAAGLAGATVIEAGAVFSAGGAAVAAGSDDVAPPPGVPIHCADAGALPARTARARPAIQAFLEVPARS